MKILYQLPLAAFLLGFSVAAHALQYVGNASASFSVEHDDNIRFVEENPTSSMKAVLSAAVATAVTAQRWGASLIGSARDTDYSDNEDLDSQQYRIELRGNYALTANHGVRANLRTSETASLDEVFGINTGATTVQATRVTDRVNLSWDATWNSRWSTATDFLWTDIVNDEESSTNFNDSTSQSLSSSTTYRLTPRWALTGTVVLSEFESPSNSDLKSETLNVQGGFTYVLGPGFNVNFSIGRRITDTERDTFASVIVPGLGTVLIPVRDTTSASGLVFSGGLSKVISPISSISFSASRSISTDINGDQNEFDSVVASYNRAFSSQLSGELTGRLANSSSADQTIDDVEDRKSISASARLTYRYSPKLSLIGVFSKSRTESNIDKERKERQKVSISIGYSFDSLFRFSR